MVTSDELRKATDKISDAAANLLAAEQRLSQARTDECNAHNARDGAKKAFDKSQAELNDILAKIGGGK